MTGHVPGEQGDDALAAALSCIERFLDGWKYAPWLDDGREPAAWWRHGARVERERMTEAEFAVMDAIRFERSIANGYRKVNEHRKARRDAAATGSSRDAS